MTDGASSATGGTGMEPSGTGSTHTETTILVVEDDDDLAEVTCYHLRRAGFQTTRAADGMIALEMLSADDELPDLVLLDLMLPRLDGFGVLRQLRSKIDSPAASSIPVIIVSARESEEDVVNGLNLGADDYVIKPIRMPELIARIHAHLRRTTRSQKTTTEGHTQQVGPISLDSERFEVRVEGTPIQLTRSEYRLLVALMSVPGRVFTRDALLDQVAGSEVTIVDRNIDVHIASLRKKLLTAGSLIVTVRGIGYRLDDQQ